MDFSGATGLWYKGVWAKIQRAYCYMGTRTEAPIMRDFLFRKIVFPSNVLERSDGRGKVIGALDVVATVSTLTLGRG
jgi:hypothetical protein